MILECHLYKFCYFEIRFPRSFSISPGVRPKLKTVNNCLIFFMPSHVDQTLTLINVFISHTSDISLVDFRNHIPLGIALVIIVPKLS